MEQISSQKTEQPEISEAERQELLERTTVYINAGGRGTRMESVFPKNETGVTKALIEFNGQPMVQSHADLILQLGFRNVIVGAGDHLDVREYFDQHLDERLSVVNTAEQEDTGGDLIKAIRESRDVGENVLVENVDTLLSIKDIGDLLIQHKKTGALGTIILTTRAGVPNENAFFVDESGKVIFSQEARPEYGLVAPEQKDGFRGSSTGTVVFDTDFLRGFDWHSGDGKLSVYRDLIPVLIQKGRLYAYDNGKNFFIDTGTPDAYHKIKRHERGVFGGLGERYVNK